MAYKISDKAILVESGGETILIAETATFERGKLTLLDSDFTLSPTFVSDYFFVPKFQGTNSGYLAGGSLGIGTTELNQIEKFSFASDANSTDVGDLTQIRQQLCAQTSFATSGYASGGSYYDTVVTNVIDKYPFASDDNASDVGDLTETKRNTTGQSSDTNGYVSGGWIPSAYGINTASICF